MRLQNRVGLQLLIFVAVTSAASVTVFARDDEFNGIVHQIESHYHVRRTKIPFLGVANIFVKAARPGGVKDFKLAVFEDQNIGIPPNDAQFNSDIENSLGLDWHPIVQVYSRPQNELTKIYAKEEGTEIKLLLLTLEAREATVIQLKLDPDLLVKWLSNAYKIADVCRGNSIITIN